MAITRDKPVTWWLSYFDAVALTRVVVGRNLDVASHQSSAVPEEEPYSVGSFNDDEEGRTAPHSTAMAPRL